MRENRCRKANNGANKKHQIGSGKRHFHGQLWTNKKVTKFSAPIMTLAAFQLISKHSNQCLAAKVCSNSPTLIKGALRRSNSDLLRGSENAKALDKQRVSRLCPTTSTVPSSESNSLRRLSYTLPSRRLGQKHLDSRFEPFSSDFSPARTGKIIDSEQSVSPERSRR